MLTISSRRQAAGHAVAAARTWWRHWSGWAVTTIVVFSYLAWTVPAIRQGGPEPFIHLGRTLVAKSQASPAISGRAASYAYDGDIGFDGQYAYFLAVDPINARYYMDSPAYRYTRVLYPMTARVLALGRPDLVPFALIALNLIMIGVGTAALAAVLRRRGVSPWYAAVYGFYPGVLITLQRDTTEIMAYGLVAVAIYLFDARRRWFWSAIVFALAILARETAAIFAIGYAATLLLAGAGQGQSPSPLVGEGRGQSPSPLVGEGRGQSPSPLVGEGRGQSPSPLVGEGRGGGLRNAAIFASVSALPIVAWKVFLRVWLGSWGLDAHVEHIPFGGILSWFPWTAGQVVEVHSVVLPAVLCGIVAAWAIIRGIRRVETFVLLANVIVLVVLLERPAYNDISSSGRITVGVVLAAVLCLPVLAVRLRAWIWAAAVLWLTPMLFWFALPTARAYFSVLRHHLRG